MRGLLTPPPDMPKSNTPVIGLAAYSGVGKTTLLCQLIPLLKAKGFRVGVIKHSHHDVEIDQPGKDSFRHRQAGASPVMLVSPYRRVVISEFAVPQALSLEAHLLAFPGDEVDLILVEGFRDEAFPKIELHRSVLQKPLLFTNDPSIIALASTDTAIACPLPVLDLNDAAAIADFIINTFLSHYRD